MIEHPDGHREGAILLDHARMQTSEIEAEPAFEEIHRLAPLRSKAAHHDARLRIVSFGCFVCGDCSSPDLPADADGWGRLLTVSRITNSGILSQRKS
jgi:hypothetical protein